MIRMLLIVPIIFVCSLLAQAQTTWFPLTLPWDDSTKTIIDASDLLVDYPGQDPATVIDARGHVIVRPDGHFYFEKTGKRARFWGTVFLGSASFPPCPSEPLRSDEFNDIHAAEKISRRLAKLGVNVVRFHHMDTWPSPAGIWDRDYYEHDTQHFDSGQIKRLDYLISQLRKNGIYTNLNLKVGRHFGPQDGVVDAGLFTGNLNFFQGVSHFDPIMINLQKDYARKLLTHVNPYTGLSYVEDPCIAFIEIANEDAIFGNLLNDGGLNYLPNVNDSLPKYYSKELDTLWNNWLTARYVSRQALETAWTDSSVDSTNKIRNGGFENGLSQWNTYVLSGIPTVEPNVGPGGSHAVKIDVVTDGIPWHYQLCQNDHSIEVDKLYEFSFYGKARTTGPITIDIMKGIEPWTGYGIGWTVQLTPDWQHFTTRFYSNATDLTTVRPTFELGATTNTLWIDQVEFRQVSEKGLDADENLGTVRRPVRSDLKNYYKTRIVDLFRFYSETDENYFVGMRRFLKEELGVQALITGTAPWWAYLGDTAIQSKLDYVDSHYYWDHPNWTNLPAWSTTGWKINNTPLINQLQEFSRIASQAVAGKPFSISEFNESFPNRYAAEGLLLFALIGNLQDWDALYIHSYTGSSWDYAAEYPKGYFDISGNAVKTAQFPIAARIILGNQTSNASSSLNVDLNSDELVLGYVKGLVESPRLLESKGLDQRSFLKDRLRISSFGLSEPKPIIYTLPEGSVTASNGELLWNCENKNASFLQIKGGALQGGIGFLKGRIVNLGDWAFQVKDSSPDHLAVLVQARDATDFHKAKHMIFSVFTEHQNTGMQWNSDQTSVEDKWGTNPMLIRPAQIELLFHFQGVRSLSMYALDETGKRTHSLTPSQTGAVTKFQVDTGSDRTLWYEIELTRYDFQVHLPMLLSSKSNSTFRRSYFGSKEEIE